MSKGIVDTILGGVMIAAGVVLEIATLGAATPLASLLVTAGVGLLITGVGTLIAGQQNQGGIVAASHNPVAPWQVVIGQQRVGGVVVFENAFGDSDKYLDLVIVVACHPSESVDRLLLDHQFVQIGLNNTSFTPLQQTVNIVTIVRLNNVVTVTLNADIPFLQDGDQVYMQNISADPTLNGKFQVASVAHTPGFPGSVTFTYLCGGAPASISSQGQVKTAWPDYSNKIYMETMLGTQTLGQTFAGMISGTPSDGDPGNLVQNPNNPWTSDCSLVGKTAVFLRLHYDAKVFASGIPQISFLMRGKNDILDPRTSPPTTGYSENAALCIADYLSNQTWGFKAGYGTEIDLANLIAEANICDEAVPLAPGGTEPRYTCNGTFPLSMTRGEVLRNMLMSCGGRIDPRGGQFLLYTAAWRGITDSLDSTFVLKNASAGFKWRPTTTITELFNGVKGTYVSPANNWTASDFPRYAQDPDHGYSSDANLAADDGDRRWLDIQLPFTNSASMAQRLAKIELLRRRFQGTGTLAFNLAAYPYTPIDVLSVDLPIFGWTGKELEVQAARFKLDRQEIAGNEVTLLGTELDVQETDSSIYAWDIGEELSPQGYQQAIVPDNRTPAPPTDFAATNDNGIVLLSWTAPTDAFVLNGGHIEAQYQLMASPPGLWISLAKMDPSVTQALVTDLTYGVPYNFRIRSVNAAGVPSDWVEINSIVPRPWPYVWTTSDDATPVAPNALYKTPNFGLALAGSTGTAQNSPQQYNIFGKAICNRFSGTLAAPTVALATSSTGGTIPGGQTLYVGVYAKDAGGLFTRLTVQPIVIPAGTSTNKITVTCAFGGTADGWVVISSQPDFGWQGYATARMTGGATTYDITALPALNVPVPDPNFDHVNVAVYPAPKCGILGSPIVSVAAAGGGTSVLTFDGSLSWVTNIFAGRTLYFLGKFDPTQRLPLADVAITSNTANTITVNSDLTTLSTPLAAGDLAAIRMRCTTGSTASLIIDALIDGSVTGSGSGSAMVPHAYQGFFVIVTGGTGLGSDLMLIADNDATSLTLSAPLTIAPDATTEFNIIGAAINSYNSESTPAKDFDTPLTVPLIVPNPTQGAWETLWIVVSTRDAMDNGQFGAFREIFVPSYTQHLVTADVNLPASAAVVTADSTAGAFTISIVSTRILQHDVRIKKISTDTNSITIAPQDMADVIDGPSVLINQGDEVLVSAGI